MPALQLNVILTSAYLLTRLFGTLTSRCVLVETQFASHSYSQLTTLAKPVDTIEERSKRRLEELPPRPPPPPLASPFIAAPSGKSASRGGRRPGSRRAFMRENARSLESPSSSGLLQSTEIPHNLLVPPQRRPPLCASPPWRFRTRSHFGSGPGCPRASVFLPCSAAPFCRVLLGTNSSSACSPGESLPPPPPPPLRDP